MRKFYLVRHQDFHDNTGTGVVAEGVLFDNGMGALTWLTDEPTVTTFVRGIRGIRRVHSHQDRTETIIEGVKKDEKRFEQCQDSVRSMKSKRKHKKDPDDESNQE